MARTAGIILIGNEILSGKVVDANAVYLCREFRALGVDVRKISVIPDEVELIAREVREFQSSYDWVFTSGGVGPTHDDVTIEGVARGASGSSGKIGRRTRRKWKRARFEEQSPGASTSMISRTIRANAAR